MFCASESGGWGGLITRLDCDREGQNMAYEVTEVGVSTVFCASESGESGGLVPCLDDNREGENIACEVI